MHARFVDGARRQDATSFADCFAHDRVWKIAGRSQRDHHPFSDSKAAIPAHRPKDATVYFANEKGALAWLLADPATP